MSDLEASIILWFSTDLEQWQERQKSRLLTMITALVKSLVNYFHVIKTFCWIGTGRQDFYCWVPDDKRWISASVPLFASTWALNFFWPFLRVDFTRLFWSWLTCMPSGHFYGFNKFSMAPSGHSSVWRAYRKMTDRQTIGQGHLRLGKGLVLK